jgi:hypothetical protein
MALSVTYDNLILVIVNTVINELAKVIGTITIILIPLPMEYLPIAYTTVQSSMFSLSLWPTFRPSQPKLGPKPQDPFHVAERYMNHFRKS